MAVAYHTTPEPYVPDGKHNCDFVAGFPSPPLSLCSEPISQLPMPDVSLGSPVPKQKAPKIQLLKKTMLDAQRKKTVVRGHNLPSNIEPPDMMNFFQTFIPSSDNFSESDGINRRGSLNPQFRCINNPYTFSPPVSPFKYTPIDNSSRYAYVEQKEPVSFVQFKNKNQQFFQQRSEYNCSAWKETATPAPAPHIPIRPVQLQTQRVSSIQIFQSNEWCESGNRSKGKLVKPLRKVLSTNKKKGLIGTRIANGL